MNYSRYFAVLTFILLGIFSRFLPHPPNFTALNAIALFGACSLNSRGLSILTVFAAMFLSDVIIGFHNSMPFVYLSFALVVFLGRWVHSHPSVKRISSSLLISSVIFFIVTNFGVWLMDSFYPKSLTGLGLCYLAAVPFFVNQIMGDLVYGVVLFGGFAFVEYLLPKKLSCDVMVER